MRRLALVAVLFVPFAAFASNSCKYEAPRNLQLDLNGVRLVHVVVNSQTLHLSGSDSAKGLTISGRACASDQSMLDDLKVTQRRAGDQLYIDIGNDSHFSLSFFGHSYSSLEVSMQLPASMPVDVNVGSGDADVKAVSQLQSHVGSGDLHVRQVTGKFSASVGSGDIDAHDIGSLDLGSVGSGDFKVEGVKGDARVGSIGSGDVGLRQVGGSVHADTLGSGDLTVHDVAGDFSLGAKGSGDVTHSGVKGKLSVPHDDD